MSASSSGLGSSESSSAFSGVFTTEEVDGVGDKVSGDNTTVDVQTLLEAFSNMSLRSACFIDEAFLWLKPKFLVLALLSSSAGLSGFPNYWTLDYENFAVLISNLITMLQSLFQIQLQVLLLLLKQTKII
jgi:hypothetical protein